MFSDLPKITETIFGEKVKRCEMVFFIIIILYSLWPTLNHLGGIYDM